jgi:hypothetical protein
MLQINTSQFKELLINELSDKLQWIKHCEIIEAVGMDQKNA